MLHFMTRHHYFIAIACLAILLSACSNEDERPPIPKSERGLELRIEVRNFVSNADESQTGEEAAIKSLSLFLFDADGQEVVQPTREHSIQDGKILLDIAPAGLKEPLKIYAVANSAGFADAPITENTLLQYKSRIPPAELIAKGFPMSSEPVTVPTEFPRAQDTLRLERVPSAIYIQIDTSESGTGSEAITNSSYKVEIEGLQVTEGSMFQDVASSSPTQGRTDYSAKLTAVTTPEQLAYFYQSPPIKIYITPVNPRQGETKTVTIAASQSRKRNKKYIINVKPVKAPPASLPTKSEFAVSVSGWDTEVIVVEVPEATPETPAQPQGDVVLFAEGVNVESGWYDENKSRGIGGFSVDNNMCWAFTETNMIQWWQDRYIASGHSLPPGVPNGFTPGRENAKYRQLEIFEKFYALNFKNVPGAILVGIPKYFTTYFPEIFQNTAPFFGEATYARAIAPRNLRDFSDFVVNALKDRAVVSLGIPGHETTLWGVTYDSATGLVKNIFMSDSDDLDDGQIYVGLWERRSVVENTLKGTVQTGGKTIDSLSALYAYPGKPKSK